MRFKDIPIQQKLMRVILLISGIVLLVTCVTFFAYESYSFKQNTKQKLSTIGKVIAANSTAALAFDDSESAKEILDALKAEPNIIAACIYDTEGHIFSRYSANPSNTNFPLKPGTEGYLYMDSHLEGFEPVIEGKRRLGTLYLKSDLEAINERFRLYSIIVTIVVIVSFLLAYFLSRIIQKSISKPILVLASTAKTISDQHDYSVRVSKSGNDEIGSLTDAFNHMLIQIDNQNKTLSEFNHNLEQMIKDRTLELQVANKELESFSYSISHDLRAPVRAIHSYVKIFEEDYISQLDDEGKRLINNISRNGKKMGVLIDDLLAFSKLGRKDIVKEELSMNDIVGSVWNDLYKMEQGRNIQFILKDLPKASAEKTTIQQVWVNLISNALKYTLNNINTIVEISFIEKDNELIYSIKDNGVGFDMRYYDKLFGVFQRLHSQEEFEGTGVGLAIVKRIIDKHGGKIWAESKVDEGTVFYFSLPK